MFHQDIGHIPIQYLFLVSQLQFKLTKYKEGKHLPTCNMKA
jgi:hypothetical protein